MYPRTHSRTPACQRVVQPLTNCSPIAGAQALCLVERLKARNIEPVKVSPSSGGGAVVWHVEAGVILVSIFTNAGSRIEETLPLSALEGVSH